MANPLVLLPSAVTQPRSPIIYGVISPNQPAPSSFSDPLYVTRPNWRPDYFWAITDWPACHGATLPAQGAECVLSIDAQQNLRCLWWDGVYGGPALVSALPPDPVDGAEIYFLADSTNGIVWHLRYRAASASAYKWEFLGGPNLSSIQAASVSSPLPATTWSALIVSGDPTVTLPLGGDYEVESGAHLYTTNSGVTDHYIGIRIGTVDPTNANCPVVDVDSSHWEAIRHDLVLTGQVAGSVLLQRYYAQSATTLTYRRAASLSVRPRRVG